MTPRMPIAAGISTQQPGDALERASADTSTSPATIVATSPMAERARCPPRMLRDSWAQ